MVREFRNKPINEEHSLYGGMQNLSGEYPPRRVQASLSASICFIFPLQLSVIACITRSHMNSSFHQ